MLAVRVNMTKEMLNDSKFFLKMARKSPEDREMSRRYLRASLLYVCIAVEGYVNNFILDYVEKNKDSLEKDIEKYLTSEISIHTKLTVGLKIITGDSLKNKKEPYRTFKEMNYMRNKIVHYSSDEQGEEVYEQLTLETVEKAIKNAKDMIIGIHQLEGSDYPLWVREI
ncbi:hypothetical protein [Candidatus Contubernalis alkaliaceticus]|uniref:hypothetical protein n=1 Tax=Candidatus Contubernalis alkaliaceticus TaxID=338645 RepID=UPI001F4C0BE4|nr:hypothetical protein [Candidatus Contubernalis alkalaceticus]UNC91928.1 hypothetical protein HUE98_07360 [Candidatus Contubernalis alkalaceticus]